MHKFINKFLLTLGIVLLTSCSLFSRTDYTIYGNFPNFINAVFSVDPEMKVYYRFHSFKYDYDGIRYVKCINVEPDSIDGPWIKEKNTNFELFLRDFYKIYGDVSQQDKASIVVNSNLKKEQYEINLTNDYWYYYTATVKTYVNGHIKFVEDEHVENYKDFINFTAYCYLPNEKEFVMLTVANFSYWSDLD